MPSFYHQNRKLVLFIIIMMILKAGFLFFNSRGLELNPDEYGNYHIAESWLQGKGYTRWDEATQTQKKLAFYATFPIWVYAIFIKAEISIAFWVLLVHIANVIFYGLSIYFFRQLLFRFIASQKILNTGTFLYAIYPSTLFYIGSLFWYENLTMPILVYVIYQLIRIVKGEKTGSFITILLPVLITLSCLFRGQLLFIYFFIFGGFILIYFSRLIKKHIFRKKIIYLFSLTACLIILTHLPILVKNYRMFGGLLLSTQPGFELLQGHNPHADGKWTMAWTDPGEPLYDYVIKYIPDFKTLDQYTESKERAKLAKQWIKNNPEAEFFLLLRKIKLFFTPNNSPFYPGTSTPFYHYPNPINLIVHIGFIAALAGLFIKKLRFCREEFLLTLPIFATIILSLIFFFGHRWRFYAEPFMLLLSCIFIQKLIQRPKSLLNPTGNKLAGVPNEVI